MSVCDPQQWNPINPTSDPWSDSPVASSDTWAIQPSGFIQISLWDVLLGGSQWDYQAVGSISTESLWDVEIEDAWQEKC